MKIKKISNILNKIIICFLFLFICLYVVSSLNLMALLNTKALINDLEIYFYQLGTEDSEHKLDVKEIGDSCIIKSGNCEILIDAGSKKKSCDVIMKKMREVCTDNIWEYVIVTHADSDHIEAFLPDSIGHKGVFSIFDNEAYLNNDQVTEESLKKFKLETIIDFDFTVDSTVKIEGSDMYFTTENYNDYVKCRNKLVETGTIHYSASQCTYLERGFENKNDVLDGASELQKKNSKWKDNLGSVFSNPRNPNSDFKLKILYNYFYDHKLDIGSSVHSYDKNNISVCTLITMNGKKFLFTGDLEEYSSESSVGDITLSKNLYGETYLLDYNPELKDGVDFYKAAHHGSRTSNSTKFIDAIRPNYVVIPVVAGTYQHNKDGDKNKLFPAIEVTNNLFKYTDYIYIPSYALNKYNSITGNYVTTAACSYYGDITISLKGENIKVETQYLKNKLIQHTEYFSNNRPDTLYIYNFDINDNIFGNCTLIKYGHTEIIVDCGDTYDGQYHRRGLGYVSKIENYCRDGVIEYVVATHGQRSAISQFTGNNLKAKTIKENNGIFSKFKINNIIDFGSNFAFADANGTFIKKYNDYKKELIKTGTKYYSPQGSIKEIFIDPISNFKIKIMNSKNYMINSTYDNENSIFIMVTFKDQNMLFVGDNSNSNKAESDFMIRNPKIKNITYFRASNATSENTNSTDFINKLNPKYTVLSLPGNFSEPGGSRMFNDLNILKSFLYKSENNDCAEIDDIDDGYRLVYMSSYYDKNGVKKQLCGDLCLSIRNFDYLNKIVLDMNGTNNDIPIEKTEYYKILKSKQLKK